MPNHTIHQIWNIIGVVYESHHYVPDYLDLIQKEITILLSEYVTKQLKTDLDDEVTLVYANNIRLLKSITESHKNLFEIFDLFFNRSQGLSSSLLQCLNMYIMYDN